MYLDGERDAGGTRVGQATYGLQRPDVVGNLGSQQFLLSGFVLQTTVAPGPHTVYVYAHPSDQPANQGWTAPKQAAVMAVTGAPQPGTVAGEGGGAVTFRSPNLTGSVTLDLAGVGSNYPPGPGGHRRADLRPCLSWVWLLRGCAAVPRQPVVLRERGCRAAVVDFSLGYGSNLFGVGALTQPNYYAGYVTPGFPGGSAFANSYSNYVLPAWRRFGWGSGPSTAHCIRLSSARIGPPLARRFRRNGPGPGVVRAARWPTSPRCHGRSRGGCGVGRNRCGRASPGRRGKRPAYLWPAL